MVGAFVAIDKKLAGFLPSVAAENPPAAASQ